MTISFKVLAHLWEIIPSNPKLHGGRKYVDQGYGFKYYVIKPRQKSYGFKTIRGRGAKLCENIISGRTFDGPRVRCIFKTRCKHMVSKPYKTTDQNYMKMH